MKVYKVWVDVEEIDEEADRKAKLRWLRNVREFATEEEAVAFAIRLADAHWDGPLEWEPSEEVAS